MDLRHLRYFQAVAEELSFSKAALRLRIAQPALSRAVKELEEDLDVQLLERTRSRVRRTEAGTVLLREAGLLMERWEESIRRVKRTAAGEEGELRLGYIGPPTQPFLGRLLGEYRKRFPRVSLHLEERTPERVWEMVARGRFSAGLTRPVRFGEEQGMRMEILREERLGIVCRKRDPVLRGSKELGWAQLESHPLIVLARREGVGLHDTVLAGCRAAGFAPRLAHTPSLVGAVMSYVEAGAGWGVVVDSVVPVQGELRFVPLTPAATVPLALVWQEEDRSPAVERFRDLVLEWKEQGQLWAGSDSSGATGC